MLVLKRIHKIDNVLISVQIAIQIANESNLILPIVRRHVHLLPFYDGILSRDP